MGRQRGQVSSDIRQLIIEHHTNKYSIRDIAKMVDRSHSTVYDVIKRFKTYGNVGNQPRSSCRKILSQYEERWILREIKKNPKVSAVQLAKEIKIYFKKSLHPETVRNVLRKHNLHGRVARKKPYISEVNKKKRKDYAQQHINKDYSFWSKVIFTDESKINMFGSDGKTYVWRKPNEALNPKNLCASMKHGGGSVMVWGCMSAAGPGQLHIIEGIMDQNMYLEILKENIKQSAEKLGIAEDFYLYQDNDPKHKAWRCRMWLLHNCPHVLETPPQSPDLNVIEHLWQHIKTRIHKRNFSNKMELKQILMDEWNKIEPSYCEKLVRSIPQRLADVIQNDGYPTKY